MTRRTSDRQERLSRGALCMTGASRTRPRKTAPRDIRRGTVVDTERTIRPVSLLHELDERAERRLRVHERNGGATAAGAGRLVDHLVALRLHALERGGAVV